MKNHPSIFIALMAKRIWDPNYNRQKFIFSKTFWKHLKIVPSNANAVGHYRSLVRTGLTGDKRLQRKLKMHRILNNKDNAIRPCDRVCKHFLDNWVVFGRQLSLHLWKYVCTNTPNLYRVKNTMNVPSSFIAQNTFSIETY